MDTSLIFTTALIIAGVVCGIRIITDEGKIGYFLRKPFENMMGWKAYIMSPIILCSVCMCSFWLFSILMAAFISGVLFEFYQLLELTRSRLNTFWKDLERFEEDTKN